MWCSPLFAGPCGVTPLLLSSLLASLPPANACGCSQIRLGQSDRLAAKRIHAMMRASLTREEVAEWDLQALHLHQSQSAMCSSAAAADGKGNACGCACASACPPPPHPTPPPTHIYTPTHATNHGTSPLPSNPLQGGCSSQSARSTSHGPVLAPATAATPAAATPAAATPGPVAKLAEPFAVSVTAAAAPSSCCPVARSPGEAVDQIRVQDSSNVATTMVNTAAAAAAVAPPADKAAFLKNAASPAAAELADPDISLGAAAAADASLRCCKRQKRGVGLWGFRGSQSFGGSVRLPVVTLAALACSTLTGCLAAHAAAAAAAGPTYC